MYAYTWHQNLLSAFDCDNLRYVGMLKEMKSNETRIGKR